MVPINYDDLFRANKERNLVIILEIRRGEGGGGHYDCVGSRDARWRKILSPIIREMSRISKGKDHIAAKRRRVGGGGGGAQRLVNVT